MRIETFAEIEPEFVERAHRMVWRHMATVGPDGRPRTRIVHPVWEGAAAHVTSLRVGPKADASIATPMSRSPTSATR